MNSYTLFYPYPYPYILHRPLHFTLTLTLYPYPYSQKGKVLQPEPGHTESLTFAVYPLCGTARPDIMTLQSAVRQHVEQIEALLRFGLT